MGGNSYHASVTSHSEKVVRMFTRDTTLHYDRIAHPIARRMALCIATVALVLLTGETTSGQARPLTVNTRVDTQNGLPPGGAHWAGVSDIIWGQGKPIQKIHVRMVTPAGKVVERDTATSTNGSYRVSVDEVILAKSQIYVTLGAETKQITIPEMHVKADAETQIVSGVGPPGISDLTPNNPATLEVTMAGVTHQLTTDMDGKFSVDFGERVFSPAALGVVRYVDESRNSVFLPAWAMDPFTRGKAGDAWADLIVGQPNYAEIAPNKPGPNAFFNPAGTLVDRHQQPNRVFVYDAGNSRVLGFDHLGYCGGSTELICTTDSDCGGRECVMDPKLAASIVIGQPDFSTGACNGDSSYAQYPDVPNASASTLCGLREEQMSISEGGSGATMATDKSGGLYVPDIFNNRVLYYSPADLTSSRLGSIAASDLWGQADFAGTHCNRGAVDQLVFDNSLCLGEKPGGAQAIAGVDIDEAGNLWVADTVNHRVVRFPYDASVGRATHQADLVLGQSDMSSSTQGISMDKLRYPTAVRVTRDLKVYVADGENNRVQVFVPPLRTGMKASSSIVGLQRPLGLELADDDSLWVSEYNSRAASHYVNGLLQQQLALGGYGGFGGVGIDRDNNLLTTSWHTPLLVRALSPSYTVRTELFHADTGKYWANHRAIGETYHSDSLAVSSDQLVVSDYDRLLYWNEPDRLSSGAIADGSVFADSYRGSVVWPFTTMRSDSHDKLWVARLRDRDARLMVYQEPLTEGALPVSQLISPVRILGGGTFDWSGSVALGSIVHDPLGDRVWLVDENYHRVFRIRDVNSAPVVDIVLGQRDAQTKSCNQGRGIDSPSIDSLCHPGHAAVDPYGNLFISNSALEFDGPGTLHFFDRRTIPDRPEKVVYGIPATRVFGRDNNIATAVCLDGVKQPLCHPWQVAFDTFGNMAVGLNRYKAVPWVLLYNSRLGAAFPFRALGDWYSLPYFAIFADNGRDLWVQDGNRNRVLKYLNPMGVSSNVTPIPTIVPMPTSQPGPLDDSRLIVDFQDLDGTNLYTMRLDGTDMTQINFDPANDQAARVNPRTGSQIAFVSRRDGAPHAFLMNMDGSGVRRLGSSCATSQSATFSHDGTMIVLDCDGNLVATDTDGKNLRAIPVRGLYPDISHDDQMIVYVCGLDICTAKIDGSDIRRLTSTNEAKYSPSWSPTDKRIVYQISVAGKEWIEVINSDGSDWRRISEAGSLYSDRYPCWLPDGSGIVFSSTRSGWSDLYRMVIDGDGSGTAVRITDSLGEEARPSVYHPRMLVSATPTITASATPVTQSPTETSDPAQMAALFLPLVLVNSEQ